MENKKSYIYIGLACIALILGTVWWLKSSESNDPGLVARKGIHWHPELQIFVKGEKVEIPQNIGIGAIHLPVHTHDDIPIIHLEFGGVVKEKDIMLGVFFRNWSKDMRSFGANMKMIVNGRENTEFENYVMHDGDKIELRYD